MAYDDIVKITADFYREDEIMDMLITERSTVEVSLVTANDMSTFHSQCFYLYALNSNAKVFFKK